MPYDQRIQQVVKDIGYMDSKWARSWSTVLGSVVECGANLHEFGLLFAHSLVQYESYLVQVCMLCETQWNC